MDLKGHLWYLVFLVLVVLFFYSPHLHLDLYPNTQYFEDGGISDLQKHFVPNIFMIKEGNYFWNDYSFGGEPFFGIPNKFTFYPFLLIFLIFNKVSWIANLSILFHLLLAAVSMYFLGLRIFNGKKEESTIASIMFVLGGFMFSMDYLSYLDFLFAYALLPLILLFYFNASRSRFNIFFCALFLALQYYAGAIEIFLLTATLLLLLTIYFAIKKELKIVKYCLVIFFICFGLIAPKLFMDLDFISKSSRETRGIEHPFPGPFFTSFDSVFSRITNIPSGYHPSDIDITIGLFGLVLLLLSFGNIRLDFVKFLWSLVIVSFLLTLATPLYTFIHMLPLYSKISYINRFMIFFSVSACFLAGYGYRFLKERIKFKHLFFVVLVLLLSSFYFVGYSGRDFEDFDSKLDKVPVLEFIKSQDGLFRIFYVDVLSKEGGFIDWSFNHYLLRNKIHNVNGYDGNIVVQDYVNFLKGLDTDQLKKLGLLNVKYLVSSQKLNWPLVKKFDECNDCYPNEVNGPYIYENPFFKPRAYIVLDSGDEKEVEIKSYGLKRIYRFDYVENGTLVLSENFWSYDSWVGEEKFKINGVNTGIRVDGKDIVELTYIPIRMIIGVVVMILVLNIVWFFRKKI